LQTYAVDLPEKKETNELEEFLYEKDEDDLNFIDDLATRLTAFK
jgi:hypothetical protein